MKKFFLAGLMVFSLAFFSCDDDDDDNGGGNVADCEALGEAATDTGLEYAGEQTKANCEAYRAALEAYLANDACFPDANTKASIQAGLDDLDCDSLN